MVSLVREGEGEMEGDVTEIEGGRGKNR